MPRERKVLFLDLGLGSMKDTQFANDQLDELNTKLNDGWDILHAVPLGAASGATAIGPANGPREAYQFAQWAVLLVLERSGPAS